MLNEMELALLEAIRDSETDPVSTWTLAQRIAGANKAEIKRLDQNFRYHLSNLAEKGLLKKNTVKRGKRTFTNYTLNPEKIVCTDGAMIILGNPITILSCPYSSNCVHNHHGKVPLDECQLYQAAPPEHRRLIEAALNR